MIMTMSKIYSFFVRNPFRKEITLVLLLKLLALFALWYLCFSYVHRPVINSQIISQHFVE